MVSEVYKNHLKWESSILSILCNKQTTLNILLKHSKLKHKITFYETIISFLTLKI